MFQFKQFKRAIFAVYKIGRVCIISAGIYQIGVVQGIISHATDPHRVEMKMAEGAVASVGGKRILDRFSKEHKIASKVSDEVLEAARLHIKLKLMELLKLNEVLQEAEQKKGKINGPNDAGTTNVGGVDVPNFIVSQSFDRNIFDRIQKFNFGAVKNESNPVTLKIAKAEAFKENFYIPNRLDFAINEKAVDGVVKRISISPTVSSEDLTRFRLNLEQEAGFYAQTSRMLHGKWDVVVYDSEHPNAFVTPTVPRVIFISTSMFSDYNLTHDELGLILAHEVSHLILKHTAEQFNLQLSLGMVYMVILALLPLEMVLLAEGMNFIETGILASHSRDNETEADTMGIQIASRGCFDVAKGVEALKKISSRENKDGERIPSYTDTHPPSLKRYEALVSMAKRIRSLDRAYNPLHEASDRARCIRTKTFLSSLWQMGG